MDIAEEPPPEAARAASLDDEQIGRLCGGKYRIEKLIARGGMGRVYLGTQLGLERPVAIKILNPEFQRSDPQFARRFVLEAATAAKLSHPHIITIFDHGRTEAGDLYIAMEYLKGRPLATVIRRTGPFKPARALRLVIQVCRALREAHAIGIVHRDLKPGNIFLVEEGDESDHAKVLDFGLVKVLRPDSAPDPSGLGSGDVELTRKGVLLGSPRYMSPEQIKGQALDARTDIYSLGVILFQLIAGKPPYGGSTGVDVIYQHVRAPIPTVEQVAPDVTCPAPIAAIIQRCLAKKAADRFASMDELILHLKEALRLVTGISLSDSQVELELRPEPRPRGQSVTQALDPGAVLAAEPLARSLSVESRPPPPPEATSASWLSLPPPPSGQAVAAASAPAPRRPIALAAVAALGILGVVGYLTFGQRDAKPVEVAAVVPDKSKQEAALRSYLAEIADLSGRGRHTAAVALIQKAKALEVADPQLDIALAKLADEVETRALLASAEEDLGAGRADAAREKVRRVLERDGANEEARRILERTKAEADDPKSKATASSPSPKSEESGRSTNTDPPRVRHGGSDGAARGHAQGTAGPRTEPEASVKTTPAGASEPQVAEARDAGVLETTRAAATPIEKVARVEAEHPDAAVAAEARRAEAPARRPPRLPKTHRADTIREIARTCSVIEAELKERARLTPEQVDGATALLAKDLMDAFSPSEPVEIYPLAIYQFVLAASDRGLGRDAIASELRAAQRHGELRPH